jgi:hypothetical protein
VERRELEHDRDAHHQWVAGGQPAGARAADRCATGAMLPLPTALPIEASPKRSLVRRPTAGPMRSPARWRLPRGSRLACYLVAAELRVRSWWWEAAWLPGRSGRQPTSVVGWRVVSPARPIGPLPEWMSVLG